MVDTRVWDFPGLGNSCNILEVVSNMASICSSCPYKCIFIFKTLNFKATFLRYVVLWDFVSTLPTRNIDRKLYFSKNAWLKITREFLDSFSWNPALWERTQSSKIKGHRRNFEIARNFTKTHRFWIDISSTLYSILWIKAFLSIFWEQRECYNTQDDRESWTLRRKSKRKTEAK